MLLCTVIFVLAYGPHVWRTVEGTVHVESTVQKEKGKECSMFIVFKDPNPRITIFMDMDKPCMHSSVPWCFRGDERRSPASSREFLQFGCSFHSRSVHGYCDVLRWIMCPLKAWHLFFYLYGRSQKREKVEGTVLTTLSKNWTIMSITWISSCLMSILEDRNHDREIRYALISFVRSYFLRRTGESRDWLILYGVGDGLSIFCGYRFNLVNLDNLRALVRHCSCLQLLSRSLTQDILALEPFRKLNFFEFSSKIQLAGFKCFLFTSQFRKEYFQSKCGTASASPKQHQSRKTQIFSNV